ncbi:MAG: histidine phosphatase family protein [Pseudomonadota bacterium]
MTSGRWEEPRDETVSVYLLRHAQTDWNRDHRLQGHADRPLTHEASGELAAYSVPATLTGLPVHVSPLRRTRQTALALNLEIDAVAPALKEMDWGRWEGRRLADLRAELGDALAANEARGWDFRPDGGESPREVSVRLQSWCQRLAVTGQSAIAVTHKGVIRAAFARAWQWNMLGRPPARLDWGCLHELRVCRDGSIHPGQLNIALVAR